MSTDPSPRSALALSSTEHFLAHAIALERDAARRYEDLAAAMQTEGARDLVVFFAKMAHYSRLHLADAQARAGFRTLPVLTPAQFEWPDGVPPETAEWAGVDGYLDATDALRIALDSELRGHAYYAAIAASSRDPETAALARVFAEEEAEHIVQLRRLIASQPAA